MIDANMIHQGLRMTHIIAGAIGLIIFWIPVFARKGSRLHVRLGKSFVWCGYLVAATAAVSSIWAIIWPIGFTGITRELSPDESEHLISSVRFLFSILAVLMTWFVAGLQLGTYSMQTKGIHNAGRSRVLCFQYLAVVSSIGLTVFGFWGFFLAGESRSSISLALGIFGVLEHKKWIHYLTHPSESDKAWWYTHMESMIGSGIAFHTAFFVFGFRRWAAIEYAGFLAVVPWLIPAAIGVPASVVWIRYYRRRFESEVATVSQPT